jgi:putative DNA methylase
MIETTFDVPFVADLALREKQIQQNYRPIIAVHKWFARRPGTLFRALILSEFVDEPLRDTFYRSHNLAGRKVADPFMGGGTPLIESNRVGCDVVGYDINPMSYWIVRQEIEHLNLVAYRIAANELRRNLEKKIGHLYRTQCLKCGSPEAHAKYFLWVKTMPCVGCGKGIDLFPGYLVAEDVRHPLNVFVCGSCGDLNECEDRKDPGNCRTCMNLLSTKGPASRNRCECPHCRTANIYPVGKAGAPTHRMFAIEYYCNICKPTHTGRFFKKPNEVDLSRYVEAEAELKKLGARYIPDDEIPRGDETDRLHRWGYQRYREMFNVRQLLGLEYSCRLINEHTDEKVRHALSTNLSDLLRYQNMVCRYDTMALKSLDIFSVHGFPVGLIECESNLLGIEKGGASIGSGGWSNIIDKFEKAKAYCEKPFEVRHEGTKKVKVPIVGEWIGEHRNGELLTDPARRSITIRCGDASKADLPPASLDAVFTDPPYYGSVQYAELMDFCYVWLRRLVPTTDEAFRAATTRHASELTENDNMKRGLETFAEGLSSVLSRMAIALKPGAPLAFTYHHNKLEAYIPVAVAILDAGLIVSAAIPCPAEMEASIHINGTGSSIIDTVFVCRSERNSASQPLGDTTDVIAATITTDVRKLGEAGIRASNGDIRCITFGHLVRVVVGKLCPMWDKREPTADRVARVRDCLETYGLDTLDPSVTHPDQNGARRNEGPHHAAESTVRGTTPQHHNSVKGNARGRVKGRKNGSGSVPV